uniref:Uncharacterized protein n=1 Tax=Meloidogyne hapla TaxID=6305 RepID=A0A1I8BH68_MELHA
MAIIPMYQVMIWYLSGYLAVILNISSAMNAPILYLNSSDYKAAYKKEISKIKSIFYQCKSVIWKPNVVAITSVTVLPY